MVPDAMDRMYEDTLSYLVPGREPLSGKMADVLSDGLELRIEKRIKTVDELLKRLWEADYHSMTGNGQAAGGTYTAQSTGNHPSGVSRQENSRYGISLQEAKRSGISQSGISRYGTDRQEVKRPGISLSGISRYGTSRQEVRRPGISLSQQGGCPRRSFCGVRK